MINVLTLIMKLIMFHDKWVMFVFLLPNVLVCFSRKTVGIIRVIFNDVLLGFHALVHMNVLNQFWKHKMANTLKTNCILRLSKVLKKLCFCTLFYNRSNFTIDDMKLKRQQWDQLRNKVWHAISVQNVEVVKRSMMKMIFILVAI